MSYKKIHHAVIRLAVFAAIAVIALPSYAALQINITQSSNSAIPIAIAPFASNAGNLSVSVSQIASRDLASTGLFKVFDQNNAMGHPATPDQVNYNNWRTQGVDNLAIGSVTSNGNGGYQIPFYILDTAQGQATASYRVNAGANQLRDAGHTIANLIYQHFIGKKGYFLSKIAYVTVTGSSLSNRTFRLVVSDYDGSHPATVYTSHDPVMAPSWSPNGKALAYVAYNVARGTSSVRIQDLSSGDVRIVSSGHGVNSSPAWSPNGQKLAFAKSTDGNTNIYVYDVSSGQTRQLTNGGSINTEPAWSPDGSHIAFTSDRGGQPEIYEMSSSGGDVQRLTFNGKSNQRPDFSPDGKQLAYVQQDANGFRIAVMDLSNNNVQILTNGPLDDSPSFSPNGQAILYSQQGNNGDSLATVSINGDARSTLSQAGDVREPAWGPSGS